MERCYQLVLHRPADDIGLESYITRLRAGELDPIDVIDEMLRSEEYLTGQDFRGIPLAAQFDTALSATVRDLSIRLEATDTLSAHRYSRAWQSIFGGKRELVIGQQEYGRVHRQRFYELCNAVELLCGKYFQPRVIEFGVSGFSGIYKELFPGIRLTCVDRPYREDYIGFTETNTREISGCDDYFTVDLNVPLVLTKNEYFGHLDRYDMILFTEILEHLTANPVDILKQLLALLASGGHIYLSTPNFFRRDNRAKMAIWENPQELYPAGDANWDAHYHYREYGHKEMLRFIEEAGGRCCAFYFSDCWDGQEPEMLDACERGNMVFVIGRHEVCPVTGACGEGKP